MQLSDNEISSFMPLLWGCVYVNMCGSAMDSRQSGDLLDFTLEGCAKFGGSFTTGLFTHEGGSS